ncbi:hypothetical protein [Isoptericola sp. NPDC056605]|uniref:hypothetical protein n=1 Tax=Isoptericola sp. NPDC056605 TaxID=3345876 RepID=UPI0036CD10BC
MTPAEALAAAARATLARNSETWRDPAVEPAPVIPAIAHTQAALPMVYALDRAMEAVVDAAVKLVDEGGLEDPNGIVGVLVPTFALDRLRAAVTKLRDIPTGAPLGRRWKP